MGIGFLLGYCLNPPPATETRDYESRLQKLEKTIDSHNLWIMQLQVHDRDYDTRLQKLEESNVLLAKAGMLMVEEVAEHEGRLQALEQKGPRRLFKNDEDRVTQIP